VKRETRLALEHARKDLAAAKAELRIHEARSSERRERGGALLEVSDEHAKAAANAIEVSRAIRQLRRQLEAEQLELARKQSAGSAAGTASVKRNAAARTRKVARELAALGEKADRRGINKKIAPKVKVRKREISERTAARHLEKIRKSPSRY
jgi:hypothetical protein